jgi:hypothetical protein
MTLFYFPLVGLYAGWSQHFAARKLHFCCNSSSINASWRQFELVWEWSDPPSQGSHESRPAGNR